jgi:glutathione-specific gamma-glutamylcyclotransferase
MWLFGYGSLMWDGWETAYGCARRLPADLPEYARIFNKKSLERWGTHALPGLTLNLARHATPSVACRGVAFQFDDAARADIEDYLCARETCPATEVSIQLPDTAEVGALTYIYDGPRLIEHGLSLEGRAAMILAAEGVAGSSYDYLKGVRAHLAELGVADPEVERLWEAVETLKGVR